MGTISDKLMRIINTKEDIRQALISKGYDVPTSIPFKEYAKMISDLPCKVDDFPKLPGDVTRWHFGGLTNEMMSAMDDPRIEDADHKGRFLSFRNFAWKGMSGVGGYVTNKDIYEYDLDRYSYTFIENSTKVHDFYIVFELIGYDENFKDGFNLDVRSISQGLKYRKTYTKNGIYIFQYKDEEGLDDLFAIGYNGNGGARSNFTVKILPLYPGFILGDGVNDFAVTEKELNFEDTYTVYTAFIPFQNNPTKNMILCGADSKKTFSMQYSSLVYVSFIAGNNYYINADFVNGLNLFACKRNGNNIYIKNLLTNKVVTGTCGDWVENAGLYYLWKNATYASFARAAIAGQTICNGYYSTDEDDEKVLNWYKKQYPWLFPYQAWTVVGKTNEDEDRATIANITGNGNDLVLSNFGFAEGSGYGSYPFGMNVWKPDYIADQPYGTVHYPNDSKSYATAVKNNTTNFRIKFRLRGLPEGGSFLIRVYDMNDLNTILKTYTYMENGIHEFVYNDPNKPARIILYNGKTPSNMSEFYLDIIPEYEGYLVTDGVDDKITSSTFEMGNDWTVIGDWELINTGKNDNAGIVKFNSIVIYNYNPILINIKNGRNNLIPDQNTVNAICSDGRIYSKDWKESIYNEETESTSKNLLTIGYSGNDYTKIAFKNLAIYPTVLSREDCIKAYNYLQTLKAK